MITSSDQDRRIEHRSIELGAGAVEVAAIGPASIKAVLARYTDGQGGILDTERVAEDGTATPIPTRYARPRWLRYAGKLAGRATTAAIVTLALLAPASIAAEAHSSTLRTHRQAAEATAATYLAPLLTPSEARRAAAGVGLRSAPCRPAGHRWKRCPVWLHGDPLTCRFVFHVRARPRQWAAYLVAIECSR